MASQSQPTKGGLPKDGTEPRSSGKTASLNPNSPAFVPSDPPSAPPPVNLSYPGASSNTTNNTPEESKADANDPKLQAIAKKLNTLFQRQNIWKDATLLAEIGRDLDRTISIDWYVHVPQIVSCVLTPQSTIDVTSHFLINSCSLLPLIIPSF